MLKLQKILIQGFKSFADKTELAFDGTGVAAIVGPNGCGKSNISDAIAWVLGEQSAKSLRGGRMEDVIFNGTRARLPLGLAEVTLTLVDPEIVREASVPVPGLPPHKEPESEKADEEASAAEAPEAMEATIQAQDALVPGPVVAATARKKRRPKFQPKPGELVVSRRLFRSGESEYLINGRQVRLRDVQDIFMGTGLGPDSYAIIEQGRVGLILSSKPSDRRSIIEEAAGITRFKSKRKLAESKLEQAKQNLLRVNDITEEVSKQLGSLKRQAAKARRYRELRERMRELTKDLFNARARVLTAVLEQSEHDLNVISQNRQQKHQQIEEQEGVYHQNNSSIFNLEDQLKKLREQLSQLSLEMERGQQRIQFQKEQLRELEARSLENAQEVERLTQQEDLCRNEVEQKENSQRETAECFDRINANYEAQESHHQALQAKVLELESSNDCLRSQLLDCVGKVAALRNQSWQLDELDKQMGQQIARLITEREEATVRQQQLSQAQQGVQQQHQEEERQLLEFRERISSLAQILADLKEKEALAQEQLLQSKERYSSNIHRLKSLEELAAHHAFSTEAVRLLLSVGAESGASGFQTPGILADLVEVEPCYELAVEEFLKQELEYLLVESPSTVQEGIALLRKTGAGRSTFLLCANGQSDSPSEPDRAASELADQDPSLIPVKNILKIPDAFETATREALPQLYRAFIVSGYQHALELAQRFPQLVFLTPEGEVLRGRLISGGGKAAGGHLSLKREIRELERNVAVLQKEIASQEESVQNLRQSLQAQESDLNETRQKAQELEKSLIGSDLRLKQIDGDLSRIAESQSLANLELQKTEEEKAQLQTKRFQFEQEITSTEARKTEVENEVSAQQANLKQLKDQSSADLQLLSELRSELATFRERKLAAEVELNRLTANLQECQERISRLNLQKAAWSEQSKAIGESTRQVEELLFSQAVHKATLEAEIRSKENELAETRAALTSLEQDLKMQRAELEEVQGQKTRLEIEQARLSSDFYHLQETCSKELGVSLDEIRPASSQQLTEVELAQLDSDYQELKHKIEDMGPVNMMALEEYQECEQRFQFLSTQRQDLLDSIEDTSAAIKEIDQVCREQFSEAFIAINANFQESFKSLFGGGYGEMKLLDEQDELDSGIEIIAQPPGKRLQNVLLLSGGEKALTAIALLLAIFRFQPSPFCVLDEVDAPLDEINNGRYSQKIKSMSSGTQFILITHSKKTMEIADTLYGVTMQEAGVSKLVSVQFQ